MTTPHIALLRGVNVGRAKRVGMAELKGVADGLGWGGARTLLNSGNLVFTDASSGGHALRLETALAEQLGLRTRVTIFTAEVWGRVVADNPFGEEAVAQPSRLLVTLPRSPEMLERLAPLTATEWAPERLHVGTRAAYSWHPDGLSSGALAEALDRAGKDGVTGRNWGTVLKLQAAAAALA